MPMRFRVPGYSSASHPLAVSSLPLFDTASSKQRFGTHQVVDQLHPTDMHKLTSAPCLASNTWMERGHLLEPPKRRRLPDSSPLRLGRQHAECHDNLELAKQIRERLERAKTG